MDAVLCVVCCVLCVVCCVLCVVCCVLCGVWCVVCGVWCAPGSAGRLLLAGGCWLPAGAAGVGGRQDKIPGFCCSPLGPTLCTLYTSDGEWDADKINLCRSAMPCSRRSSRSARWSCWCACSPMGTRPGLGRRSARSAQHMVCASGWRWRTPVAGRRCGTTSSRAFTPSTQCFHQVRGLPGEEAQYQVVH
jgi:hypothetical protein